MDYKTILTNAANDDLLAVVKYIAQDNANEALKFHDRIIDALQNLSMFPRMGSEPKNKLLQVENYRKLTLGNYIAWYKIDDVNKRVNIIRFLHGAMKQEEHLLQ